MKLHTTIYYSECADGSVDIIVNINGHDKGNYNYCNLQAVINDYRTAEFVNINE